jgi:hypothetical protein
MRDLGAVMDAMLRQVPREFKYRESLARRFGFIRDSLPYTAPELLSMRWEQCAEVLGDYIPEPDTEWQKTLADIFNAVIDYKQF